MVTPFHLHRALDRAQALSAEERVSVLSQVLNSSILAVIRRIPQTMSPFSDQDKEMIARWADKTTGDEDVSDRDFAFHLMANCKVPAARILGILEQNKTFSRSALEHIQQVLDADDSINQLNNYLGDVADELIKSTEVRPRDRARHMFITLSKNTGHNWYLLALRFSVDEIHDLRQRVIDRFLSECPEGSALTTFVDNVVKMCIEKIEAAGLDAVHKEASHMHWVFMCLERIGARDRISSAAHLFANKFGTALPRSVRWKIDPFVPVVPRVAQRIVRPQLPIPHMPMSWARPVVRHEEKPVEPPLVWQPRSVSPVPVLTNGDRETNAQIAARLGVTKEEVLKMKRHGLLKG